MKDVKKAVEKATERKHAIGMDGPEVVGEKEMRKILSGFDVDYETFVEVNYAVAAIILKEAIANNWPPHFALGAAWADGMITGLFMSVVDPNEEK